MNTLTGKILTLPKMSGNVGAKTIYIGVKGDDGATFIPSVSADGIISWTNDKDLPNPEPVNTKGAKGDKGDKGDRGPAGPQGPQGEKGETGADGKDGQDGQPGKDGSPGKDGVDGKTPVKGEDYWTDVDKQEIVDDALERIKIPDVSVELPVFDLAALGMSAVTLPAGVSSVSTDTTELQSALSKGDVIFVIPVNMGGTTIPVHAIMQGIALGTSYQCMTLFVLDGASALVINVEPGSVTVMVMPASTAVGFPAVTAEDNGKFLQVVDGSWAAVALQDVSEVGA